MDEDSVRDNRDVRRRDNTGATGEDTFNREAMPKVMQVSNSM
jgi:Microfibril-associated/Pre-mRNA processing